MGSGSSPSSPYFDVHVSRRPTMPILLLNPYESVDLDILFSPSSITEDRSSTIQFQSSEIGHTIYHVHGRGLKPEIMPETTVTSKIGDTSTAFIAFFNPFVDPIPIDVYWETSLSMNSTTAAASGHNQDALKPRRAPIRSASESRRDDAVTTSDSSFKLVNRQGSKFHHSVNPLDYLEIPFSYTPQNMNQATSILVVEIKGQLKWTYPIKGIPEALVADASIIQPFETKVRDQFEREFSVTMEGFCDHDAAAGIGRGGNWDDVLDYSLEGPTRVKPDAKTDGLSAYKLELEDARLEDPKINRLEILFRISFKPTRHLDAVYTLVVSSRRSGGRWRWPVRVLIHPPPIDDKITIEGSIGKLSLVTFNLAVGVGGKNKPFQAYFTRESPAEFAVEPKTGIMVADKEENKFTIAYRPSVYGKTLVGTLIVEVGVEKQGRGRKWCEELKLSNPV